MITWSFSTQKNRSPIWYIIGCIVVWFLVIFGIVTQLYLLSVVTILFTGTYLLIENNTAPVSQIFMDEKILKMNEATFSWDAFENFHIIEANGNPIFLRFFRKKMMSGFLDIPLSEESDIEAIRALLFSIFPEGKSQEISKTDTLIHLAKM